MTAETATSTIAVGFDGSPQSHDALALGADLARATRSRLAAVVVFPTDFLVDLNLDEFQDVLRREADEKLDDVPAEVLAGAGVDLHTTVSRTDARGLHDAAEELGADMLVVGSSHRGGAGRVLLGSVGTRLLHGAPCAVAVAPSGYASLDSRDLRVILAAFDGSPESREAVARAADLAAAANATLRIVAVAGAASVGSAVAIAWATYDTMLADEKAFLERELDSLLAELPPELHADAHVVTGNPAIRILEEAEKGVDLLVAGSRGYGAVRRVMLGSVSAELLRTAPCAVLVAPRGSTEEQPPAAVAVGDVGATS
jgi:nucleotide-binding universal stress UspA family protein